MNFYQHHLGDWAAATGHLTWDEDMAYTRLLRAYYHTERPIPDGQQYRLARASTAEQRAAVDAVLAEFFILKDGNFHQKRADAEIALYQEKQETARRSAKARWGSKSVDNHANAMRTHSERNANAMQTHSERTADAMPTQCEGNANQEPRTKNQEPEARGVVHQGTDAGRICQLMRQAGLSEANPGHPDLLALIASGASDEEFVGAARTASERGKPFAYALAVLKRQRADAAKLTLVRGAVPNRQESLEARSRAIAEAWAGGQG